MIEELQDKFDGLSDEEKIVFLKSIMPSLCELFSKNHGEMMKEVMPLCMDIMKSCNMDMQGIMKMMSMMGSMAMHKG